MFATLSSPAIPNLDILFHALADKTRRNILDRLSEGPIRISDLAKPYDMSLPALSKHVRVLENAGLILREVEGRNNICVLKPETLKDAESWLNTHRIFWQQSLQSFAYYVEDKRDKPRGKHGKRSGK